MSEDILRESWVYQEIAQEYLEEGIKKGWDEGRKQGRIQGKRELLLFIVQERFPDVVVLAKQQVEGITDAEILLATLLKLSDAQTVEDARQIFLELDNSKNKH